MGHKAVSIRSLSGGFELIKRKHDALVRDIDGMYAQLGRPGKFTADVITHLEESLKERLVKAQSANFMPKLSYSTVSFAGTDNALASPWGQAYSLLSDVATFPRKALTDIYFFRGLKVSKNTHAIHFPDGIIFLGGLNSHRGLKPNGIRRQLRKLPTFAN